jgi:rubrerythrin
MRPRLLHPRSERRSTRRSSRLRAARVPAGRAAETAIEAAPEAERPIDPAVQRVREAGGPIDRACYSCQCGFVFEAKVSTTVRCPHCGAGQAW